MWGMLGVRHRADNDKPHCALIWCTRHDPDIVAICHVAMSGPTSERREHVIQRCKACIQLASGFSDSLSTLRCFLWLWFQSIFLYYHFPPIPPQPSSLCSPSLTPAPACRLWGVRFMILSPTLIQSLIRKGASLYLGLSLCSFTELSEHSLKDLVLCHCNSLFLMLLMCIPHHPSGLFHLSIFLLLGLFSGSPLARKQTLLPW